LGLHHSRLRAISDVVVVGTIMYGHSMQSPKDAAIFTLSAAHVSIGSGWS